MRPVHRLREPHREFVFRHDDGSGERRRSDELHITPERDWHTQRLESVPGWDFRSVQLLSRANTWGTDKMKQQRGWADGRIGGNCNTPSSYAVSAHPPIRPSV